uniref:NAC domain-containing protein 12-like n=1 Tax=Erigeron canadensis TaxID=72917 RepID=UPI001CB8B4E1|nr:NAC domain-containing protein 12-like [Erigeron canadensis]
MYVIHHMKQASNLCDGGHEEGWVVCRVFKKKNYYKSFESPRRSLLCRGSMVDTTTREKLQSSSSSNKDALLEHLLMYMDSSSSSIHQSFKQEITDNLTSTTHQDAMQQFVNPMHLHLPGLQSPTITTTSPPPVVSSATFNNQESSLKITYNSMMDLLGEADHEYTSNINIDSTNKVDDYDHCSNNNWADLDKFVASQLDGQMEENKHCSSFYAEHNDKLCFAVDIHDDQEVWSSLARSSALSSALMDPLCHSSV